MCKLNFNIFCQVSCKNADNNRNFQILDVVTNTSEFSGGKQIMLLQNPKTGHVHLSNGSFLLGDTPKYTCSLEVYKLGSDSRI